MDTWEISYVRKFVPIEFELKDIDICIGKKIKELNEIAELLNADINITSEDQNIYFPDCTIRYEVKDDSVDFYKYDKRTLEKLSNASIINNRMEFKIVYGESRYNIMHLFVFDLYKAIYGILEYLLMEQATILNNNLKKNLSST